MALLTARVDAGVGEGRVGAVSGRVDAGVGEGKVRGLRCLAEVGEC